MPPNKDKLTLDLSDPETAEVFATCLAAAKEVANWPNWKAQECRCE